MASASCSFVLKSNIKRQFVVLEAISRIRLARQPAQAKKPPDIKNAKWYERVTSNIHAKNDKETTLAFAMVTFKTRNV